jgi:uncharacterized repeat protein (TIGR01451 family)
MKTTLLSRFLLICSLCIVLSSARAQYVAIPDTNFAKSLNSIGSYTSCISGNSTSGYLLDTSCAHGITSPFVVLSNWNISDVTGMEYLTYLNQIDLSYNKLRRLPLYHLPPGVFTSFVSSSLDCSHNLIDTVWLGVDGPQLPGKLDLSNNNMHTFLPPQAGFNYWIQYGGPNGNQCGDIILSNNLLDSANAANVPKLPPFRHVFLDSNNIGGTYTNHGVRTFVRGNHISHIINDFTYTQGNNDDLYADYNQITKVDVNIIGQNFYQQALYLSHNMIDSLPLITTPVQNIPSYFSTIDVSYNNMHYIADQYLAQYTKLNCSHNPTLTCLPRIPYCHGGGIYLNFDTTAVTCIPNRYYHDLYNTTTPNIYSFPLCGFDNRTQCGSHFNVTGYGFEDVNGNCVKDPGDSTIYNYTVTLYHNGAFYARTTSYDGNYGFDVGDTGTFQMVADTASLGLAYHVTCPAGDYTQFVLLSPDSTYQQNIGVQCTGLKDVAALAITDWRGTHRIAISNRHPQTYIVVGSAIDNAGNCNSPMPGQVRIIVDTSRIVFSSNNMSYESGDTLVWNVNDISIDPNINLNVSAALNAVQGQQICFTLVVVPATPDANPINNYITECFTVIFSFDPNKKEVQPAGNITSAQKTLTYTVAFQNTGTDTAYYVHVRDSIDASHLDISSVVLEASSRPCILSTIPATNFLDISFPNINLPDSAQNDSMSIGWFRYSIKLQPNLPIGTHIKNSAAIYFDANAPVITDTTVTTIDTAVTTSCSDTTVRLSHAMCQGDTFIYRGRHLTVASTYIDTLTRAGGCDSILQLSLTVHALPVVTLTWDSLLAQHHLRIDGVDTGICYGDYNLSFLMLGGNPSGGSYSGSNIQMDTFHYPFGINMDTINYKYTDINGCMATAQNALKMEICEGINDIVGVNLIQLYPNPNNGSFTLSTVNGQQSTNSYTITDMLGHVVEQKTITSSRQQINMTDAAEGVYTLVVKGARPVRFVVVKN